MGQLFEGSLLPTLHTDLLISCHFCQAKRSINVVIVGQPTISQKTDAEPRAHRREGASSPVRAGEDSINLWLCVSAWELPCCKWRWLWRAAKWFPSPRGEELTHNFDMRGTQRGRFLFQLLVDNIKNRKSLLGIQRWCVAFPSQNRERHHSNRALWRLTGSRGNRLTVFPAWPQLPFSHVLRGCWLICNCWPGYLELCPRGYKQSSPWGRERDRENSACFKRNLNVGQTSGQFIHLSFNMKGKKPCPPAPPPPPPHRLKTPQCLPHISLLSLFKLAGQQPSGW